MESVTRKGRETGTAVACASRSLSTAEDPGRWRSASHMENLPISQPGDGPCAFREASGRASTLRPGSGPRPLLAGD